jgi:hypothetical protein
MPRKSDDTGVEVSLEFFPLAFFLFFCTPRVVIDGKVRTRDWGRHFFPLRPGRHTVEVFYPYFFWPETGYASLDVRVEPGELRRVNYYHWAFLVFLPGSISDGGELSEPSPPGSSSKRWAAGMLVALAIAPFLCCGGLYGMAKLGQRQKEAQDEQRAREEADVQEQIQRMYAAEGFARLLEQGDLAKAHAAASSAYRARVGEAAFADLARAHGLSGAFVLAAGRDDPRKAQASYAFHYHAYPDADRAVKVTLAVARDGGGWKVDDVAVEDLAEKPGESVKRLGEEQAKRFLDLFHKNLADSAYYQEATRAAHRRQPPQAFLAPVAGHVPLRQPPEVVESEASFDGKGWVCRCRARATGKRGDPLEFDLVIVRDELGLKVDEMKVEVKGPR